MSATSRAGGDLVCQRVVELLTDYLEDALAPDDRRRLEAHLAACPHCRAYLAQIRRTVRAIGATRERGVDVRVKDELLRLFRDWTREGS